MNRRKNTRLLGLMLAALVVFSVVPGFLIPVKAQGSYTVTVVDPADGVLYVNQSHTVILNVTDNGTAVAGLNVTLAWDLNNTMVAAWNTTNATGFVTFQDFTPNQTGTLYVFVNGTYTNTTLTVTQPTIRIVEILINGVSYLNTTFYPTQRVDIAVKVKYGFETPSNVNVTLSAPVEVIDSVTGEKYNLTVHDTTDSTGTAYFSQFWVPAVVNITVSAVYNNSTDEKILTPSPLSPDRTTYIYGWVRVQGTLEKVQGADLYFTYNGTTYYRAYYKGSPASSDNTGEFIFTIYTPTNGTGLYIIAFKDKVNITTEVNYTIGTYRAIRAVTVTETRYTVPDYPGYVYIQPGTSSVQTNVPIKKITNITTTVYANVTLPTSKVDYIEYQNPGAPLTQIPAAHTPGEAPVLPAGEGYWFDVVINITDPAGHNYNFTEAMKEGINFGDLFVNVSVDNPNIAVVDNGTHTGSWVLVPIDPDTGTARVRVWSAVDPNVGVTIDNVGLVNVSNVLPLNVSFDFTADVWNVDVPADAEIVGAIDYIAYNLTNYTLSYFAGVGHISGDITDHSGQQVPGATVVLQVWNGTAWVNATDIYGEPAVTTSAADGHYAIDNIITYGDTPLYRVKAFKDGAVGYSWNFNVPLGATATADVKLIGEYNTSGLAMYPQRVTNADTVYFVFNNLGTPDAFSASQYIARTVPIDVRTKSVLADQFNLSELTANDVLISVGGPLVNPVTADYENIAPVHMVVNGTITIVTPQGNFTWTPPSPWWNVTKGYFIIQLFEDDSGALVVTIYGTDADSTAAGAYYFMTEVYPNIDSYNGINYIVGLWQDTEPGADVPLPGASLGDTSGFSAGDSIEIVAQG